MPATVQDLAAPVKREARLVALQFLSEAGDAFVRLGNADDTEALHDFRVALRRLRSWERAYRSYLESSVGRRLRRRLRDLARATNASRDREVQLDWLRQVREELADAERPGADWLIARIEAAKRESDADVASAVAADFAELRARLERQLATYERTVPVSGAADERSFASATAPLARRLADDLREHLDRVRSDADEEEGHEARIAGKRLRYLMEPIAHLLPDAKAAVRDLKRLQDALGEMHDAHVLLAEVEGAMRDLPATDRGELVPGLAALVERLRSRAADRFAEVEGEWLGARAAELPSRARDIADQLDAAALGDREIERKYLLTDLPDEVRASPSEEVEQGYLPGERLVERIRRVKSDDGDRYYRTVKVGKGVSRIELEEEAPRRVFRAMWPLTRGRRVWKRRYRYEHDGATWEIDDFLDRDLVLAEIELPAEDAVVTIPPALAPFVVREVTMEGEFQNVNLAR
jgi:CHAD domain-containing protein/CYTH domain-containing protein